MSKTKRSPIDYKPQFSSEIFRPKTVTEDERTAVEAQDDTGPAQPQQPTSEVTFERPDVSTNERTKVRHSFDIYRDQLLALTEIQTDFFRKTGRKPKIGELVQQAIDKYVKTMKRTNDRSNERTQRST